MQSTYTDNILCFSSDITSELVKVPLVSHYCVSDENELAAKTKEIKSHFTSFLNELQQHLLALQQDGLVDVSVVKNQMIMYDKQLKIPMNHCESLKDIFESLTSPGHASFFDYELIKLLCDFGGERIKIALIKYKKKLQTFLEHRMIECSSGEYAVVIDKSFTHECSDLTQLQNRVRIVLGQKNLRLLLWENLFSSSATLPELCHTHKEAAETSIGDIEKTLKNSGQDNVVTATERSFRQQDLDVQTLSNTPSEEGTSSESDVAIDEGECEYK